MLDEIIKGLSEGKSYKRESDAGTHWLRPMEENEFEHTYLSSDPEGGGGVANLPLSILKNGRWDNDGWVETDE